MEIELKKEITVRAVAENYAENGELGVYGYGGKLNIRPKYQREFVYDAKKRNAVIDTIRKGFPLNVMYWVVADDGTFEVLDGQQRTISFCQYVNGDFSVDFNGRIAKFENLTKIEQEKILDYPLMIYFCEGDDKEKLDWFRIINIAGEKLTEQELKNAVYTGEWLTHAKSIFSKSNCAAYNLSKDYVTGSPIRQDILETALNWISKGKIEEYMSAHQHAPDADELWTYYRNVINWVSDTFTVKRSIMKGLDWGALYDVHGKNTYDAKTIEAEIQQLIIFAEQDGITSLKGIYPYVLTHKEKYLSKRTFPKNYTQVAYERQGGVCVTCGKHFDIKEMEADHITPWSKGGKTILENCQMLCQVCNRFKSNA
ncbi:MAG: DUF262 domain-containing protein [Oscillospiraceae bacterium]|nr:DUF262 domain-containing protein [Oscillospiraceae bacterium]